MKVEPFLLASTLNTIIAQRLTRRICPYCKIECTIPADIQKEFEADIEKIPAGVMNERIQGFNKEKLTFYKGMGCPRCGNTGYAGRVGIVEVIDITDKIRQTMTEKNDKITIDDVIDNEKFITMKQDGIIKVLQGQTTIEEVMRVIQN
jgi:type IV pilus assembly protein PilB